MDKNINLLQLLENLAEKMKQQDEEEKSKDPVAYAKKWNSFFKELDEKLRKESEKRKQLYNSIQMSDEKARRRFTI